MADMNTAKILERDHWVSICKSADLLPNLGVRALFNGQQVAIYRVQGRLYGISALDPFSNAAVLSRGIVGDLKGQTVVASPIYKQHFNLETGICLEDNSVCIPTYAVREQDGEIQIQAPSY
jgi:nitrite reductase (NADH) small subunit